MKRCSNRFSAGFSLLEVLVALAIMGIAVVLLLQLFSANLRALSVAGDMTSAVTMANARLREILIESSLRETAWSEARENSYPMDISISEVSPDRTDNLPVRLMEVALTVRWQTGVKAKKFTLRTVKMVNRIGQE